MTTLYFDCYSGAAGNMILGALLDAGASSDDVHAAVRGLGMPGADFHVEPVMRSGLRALRVVVPAEERPSPRTWRDIRSMLTAASLPGGVRDRALRTFDALAQAEGHVHDMPADDVHFHELGAVDALVDVVGSCAALEWFAPTRVVTSPLPVGSGTIATDHGTLPVPVPAVTELLRGAPIVGRGEGELVTPTGAALLKTFSTDFGELPPMVLRSAGYGAGSRDPETPNVVRVLVGDEIPAPTTAGALVVEANLDDMNPELLPHAVDALMAAGAQDAWVTPIVMKKGRPAFTLSVLVGTDERDRIVDVIFRETTTLGVRIVPVTKDVLDREWFEVEVAGRPVRVKVGRRGGDVSTMAPEHGDAERVARETGMALKDVYREALARAAERVRR